MDKNNLKLTSVHLEDYNEKPYYDLSFIYELRNNNDMVFKMYPYCTAEKDIVSKIMNQDFTQDLIMMGDDGVANGMNWIFTIHEKVTWITLDSKCSDGSSVILKINTSDLLDVLSEKLKDY